MNKLDNHLISLIDEIEFLFLEFNNIKTKCEYKTLLDVRKWLNQFNEIKNNLLTDILFLSSGKIINMQKAILDFADNNGYSESLFNILNSLKDIFFHHYNKYPSSNLLKLLYDEQGFNAIEYFQILEMKLSSYKINKLSDSLDRSKFKLGVKEQITLQITMLVEDLKMKYNTMIKSVEDECKERNLDEAASKRILEICNELCKDFKNLVTLQPINEQKH